MNSAEKKIVLLTAPVLSRSGYGEHARLVYESLLEYENIINLRVFVSNWGHTPNDLEYLSKYSLLAEHIVSPEDINNLQYDVCVVVGIPTEFRAPTPGNTSRFVGITAGIETDIIDDSWSRPPEIYDSICVVSHHAKNGFLNHAKRKKTNLEGIYEEKIRVIPYPVKSLELKEQDHILNRMDINTGFNFLSVAQMGPRKNIDMMIRCFVEEFHDDENVGLIFKSNMVNNSNIDKEHCLTILGRILVQYPDRKCKIHHIHGNLTEEQLHSLYVSDKVNGYITTTHGEGYGLPIFEAAYSGLPVLAPAWSGHCDFLYAPVANEKSGRVKEQPLFTKLKYNLEKVDQSVVWEKIITPESSWAVCDPADVKKKMRSFYEKNNTNKNSYDKKQALILQSYLLENFTKEKVKSMYLEEIFGPIDVVKDAEEIKEWNDFLSEMIE